MIKEIERIEQYRMGEIPDGLHWVDGIESSHPHECFSRVIQVIKIVSAQSPDNWPTDGQWRELLPAWFVSSLKVFTPEEAHALLATTSREKWGSIPWEFGSWLDAIRDRGWQWWSSKVAAEKIEICLIIGEWPASLEAFEHIIRAAGGQPIRKTAPE